MEKTALVTVFYGDVEKAEGFEFGFSKTGYYLTDFTKCEERRFPFRYKHLFEPLTEYRHTHPALTGHLSDFVPDWKTVPTGRRKYFLSFAGRDAEIGLFREPRNVWVNGILVFTCPVIA